MSKQKKSRKEVLAQIGKLPPDLIEGIAMVIETAEVEGDYHWNGEGSTWEDSVSGTLNSLAAEIRNSPNA
jgi:hypothetical protein